MIMTNKDSLSLLCIGNSFSDDAVDYLFPILKDHGVKELHIGNLYIGGCSLERHYKNIKENIPDYSYRVYRYDGLDDHPDYTLEKALLERKWDVLTLQQYSGHSIPTATLARSSSIFGGNARTRISGCFGK